MKASFSGGRLEGLPGRMVRALRLDGGLYAGLRDDSAATGQALTVVLLVALAHGLGGVIRGAYFGWNPASGLLFGVVGEISFFAVASLATYSMARYVLGAAVRYPQVLRPLGFSVAPGLLILVAALASLAGTGAEVPVFVAIIAWRLAAGFVAVRRASNLGVAKSGLALLAGVASGVAAVAITTGTLAGVLGWLGVRG